MPESEESVVVESLPRTAMASMALMIFDRLLRFVWVLRPRSWSEMSPRRSCLARRVSWAVVEQAEIGLSHFRDVGGREFRDLEGTDRLERAGRKMLLDMMGMLA